MRRYLLLLQFAVALNVTFCIAQTDCEKSQPGWDAWLNCKIENKIGVLSGTAVSLEQLTSAVATNGSIRDSSKTSLDPSIQTNSTSLVDQTSAPDLLGFASHLAKLDSKVAGGQLDSFSFYTTAYAFDALIQSKQPLDPIFYAAHPNWRRFAINVGREVPDDSGSSAVGPANIFGTRVLILNHRDLGRNENRQLIEGIVKKQLYDAAIAKGQLSLAVQNAIGVTNADLNKFGPDFTAMITGAMSGKDQIVDDLITAKVGKGSKIALEREAIRQTYDQIHNAMQWSFNFSMKKRDLQQSPDEYRIETAFDLGPTPRIELIANLGANYRNLKSQGDNSEGGRLAVQGSYRITDDPTAPRQWIIYFTGEGLWLTQSKPGYIGQLKTSIPLFDGVNLPISVSLANQSSLVQETHVVTSSNVKSAFGFTLDVSRLLSSLQH